jgi:hypothetical protein
MSGRVTADFQARNGSLDGFIREIKNGKLGDIIVGGGTLFNSLGLWKNLAALGGPESGECVPAYGSKGQPVQQGAYTVSAVPATFHNVALIDRSRKA